MKVLGFVNRYSRGVQTVQDELRENGNGEAEFKLHLGTAFLVIERISDKPIKGGEKEPENPIKPIKGGEKEPENPIKPIKGGRKESENPIKPIKDVGKKLEEIISLIRVNPNITYEELTEALGVKKSAIYERIKKLKNMGRLQRKGGRFGGTWIVIE